MLDGRAVISEPPLELGHFDEKTGDFVWRDREERLALDAGETLIAATLSPAKEAEPISQERNNV